jgi:lysozyme
MTSRIDFAMQIMEKDEGFEEEPYYCTEGYPTIGHGFRIEGTDRHDPLPAGMKISYKNSLAKLYAMTIAYDTKLQIHADLKNAYNKANDVRKAVMLSMVHQLGIYGLLKFKKFIAAMASQDYAEAAMQCLDSLAAKQTPYRWKRNASMIESGDLNAYYN